MVRLPCSMALIQPLAYLTFGNWSYDTENPGTISRAGVVCSIFHEAGFHPNRFGLDHPMKGSRFPFPQHADRADLIEGS